MLWLAVVCSCIGFVLQPVAQRHIPSERAALFFALSPLSASMIGIFFRYETLSLPAVPGIALILWGIVLSDRGASSKSAPESGTGIAPLLSQVHEAQ